MQAHRPHAGEDSRRMPPMLVSNSRNGASQLKEFVRLLTYHAIHVYKDRQVFDAGQISYEILGRCMGVFG